MSYLVKTSLIAFSALALLTSEAAAQYYSPVPSQSYGHKPGGLGLDLGLRHGGFNPNFGFGVGQAGLGVGAGAGRHGIGQGFNAGLGPLGASANGGIDRNGLGARASTGIHNTGAAFEGGVSHGGLGLGANTQFLGFGAGANIGIGERGPDLGASLAFGNLGTLVIGGYKNSYPGAKQTAFYTHPNQRAAYYIPQSFGNSPYYRPAPTQPQYIQHYRPAIQAPPCPLGWSC